MSVPTVPLPLRLRRLAFAGFLAAGASPSAAGDLRILAPSAPGGGWDVLAQALRTELSDERGDDVVEVINVPGGNGTAGLAQFVGDLSGSSLLMSGFSMFDAALLARTPVEIGRLTPIARLTTDPFVVCLPVGSRIRDMVELRAAFLADPGKIVWGGGPAGGIEHVATILLAEASEVDAARLSYVPFLTSADAAGAAAEGRVTALMMLSTEAAAEIKAGRLRAVGVASPSRVESVDAPTLAEIGISLELANWRGILGRPDMPPAERAGVIAKVTRVVESAGWRDLLARRGWRDAYLPGDAFGLFLQDQQGRIAGALRSAGLPKRAQP